MAVGAENVATEPIGRLEQAWNEADGRAFGEPFGADADFVTIRGEHLRGQEAIAAGRAPGHPRLDLQGHQHRPRADTGQGAFGRRDLGPRHGGSRGPSGPLAGERSAEVQSLVLVRGSDGWKIAGYHNALVAPQQSDRGKVPGRPSDIPQTRASRLAISRIVAV